MDLVCDPCVLTIIEHHAVTQDKAWKHLSITESSGLVSTLSAGLLSMSAQMSMSVYVLSLYLD